MTALSWIIPGVYGLVVGGWWFRHLLLSLEKRLDLTVAPSDEAPPDTRVSVIVPARNERDRIAPCIRSLLLQGPVVGQLIVVDDRSDDQTDAFVRKTAGNDPRLQVLRVDALPPAWSGKAHACHVGGQAALEGWLLFTDADCTFFPGGVAGAVAYARRHGLDFLTLWPRADHRSFWEHMLIPLCGALILYWFPPLRLNQRRKGSAFANGQFILIRADAYRCMGGHESARDGVIEDIPLARRARRAGLRMGTALGSDVLSARMYAGYNEVRDGWTRIFIGALQKPWKLLWSVWSLLGGSFLPGLAAPIAAVIVAARGWPDGFQARAAIVLVFLHFVAVYSVSYRAWGLCRCDRRYLTLYPISCLAVMEILLRSWWWSVTKKPILWRGSVTGGRAEERPGHGRT